MDSRKQFEEHYLPYYPVGLSAKTVFERNANDEYAMLRVHGAWEGWQAARSLTERSEPVGEWVKSALGDYPHLKWTRGYVAKIGEKLYAPPSGKPGEVQGD